MLFVDTGFLEVVLICITSVVGIFGVSSALEGFFLNRMKWYERILNAVGGLCLIYPGIATDIIGISLVGFVFVLQTVTKRKTIKANI
ncbi:MAG: DUF3394 domain-containing protein, partial [Clostridia bacterium]|nr:DUF3394 domain-containing protein [Clostridia bacterium]